MSDTINYVEKLKIGNDEYQIKDVSAARQTDVDKIEEDNNYALIWENASDTSYFEAQTIDLGEKFSTYDYFDILAKHHTTSEHSKGQDERPNTAVSRIYNRTDVWQTINFFRCASTSVEITHRYCTCSDNGICIGTAYQANIKNGSTTFTSPTKEKPERGTNYLIPMAIYGHKKTNKSQNLDK